MTEEPSGNRTLPAAPLASRVALARRSRVQLQFAAEWRMLEMVAAGRPLPDVLDNLCRLVETQVAADCRCGIYEVDVRAARLRLVSAPSLPAGFNQAIGSLPLSDDAGPCVRAVCLRTPVVAGDTVSDPAWHSSEFRLLAMAHGHGACWAAPIFSQTGEVLGTFVVLQRETQWPTVQERELVARVTHIASIAIGRARRDLALKRSEAFLQEAQRLSATGSFSWCVGTGELVWSDQLYRIMGFEPGGPVTLETASSRIHPDDVPLVQDLIARAERSEPDYECSHRLLLPDGTVKYVHVKAHRSYDPDGRVEYIGAVQDVTERHLSEDALTKARSEFARVARIMSLGALAASITHEVKQPLSGIHTNASTCERMLAADPPNIDGARETARRVLRDGRRAAEVVARLAALFSGKPPECEPMDLNAAAREVIGLSLNELQRCGVVVRMCLDEHLPAVIGDRIQVQQVILNLVLNASQAMNGIKDRPKELIVRTLQGTRGKVTLSVQDCGIGLGNLSLEEPFEPFRTTKVDGMGIGLSVSRRIIESHQGRLWAVPNDGPGATFTFEIPVAFDAVSCDHGSDCQVAV